MPLAVEAPQLELVLTVAAIAGIVLGIWWRTAYQVAAARADELDKALDRAQDRNSELLEELRNAQAELREATKTIQKFEALPNMERIVTLMAETSDRQDAHAERRTEVGVSRLVAMIEQHEQHASERHAKTIAALTGITTRLETLNGN